MDITKKLKSLKKLINAVVHPKQTYGNRNSGATFMETVIVITIILIIATGATVAGFILFNKANDAVAKTQIESFRTAIETYHLQTGMYPSQEQGLEALVNKPSIEPVPEKWKKVLSKDTIPKDPWGIEYKYLAPAPNGDPYGIVSYGADKVEGGEDENADITSWE